MASKGSSSECSTEQCPKQYPRFYVSNIPKFLTQIGIKTYFENSVGKVLDVELLPEAAVVTFDGLQGIDKMSSPHHIADQKLNVLHLYTEKTTLEISSPAASGLSGEIKELAGRWGVTMQAQGNTITITGHCDRVYAFRVDFSKYVNTKLIPLSNPSVATPTEAVGSYPQTQPTETTYPSMASGTSDGHLQETQAGGGIQSDSLSKLSTVSETTQVFSNLSPDALALLEKNSEEEMLGVSYYTKAGSVRIEGQSKSELEDRISRFQSAYQSILTPRRLKAEPVSVPPALDDAQVTLMVASFNSKYTQCVFVYHEGPPRMIKVVSVSSRQFDQAKKLLMEALSCSPTSAPASFPTLEVISFANGRRLTLKKADIVHENVDVIVNAANERLQHGGGVAGALDRASHGSMQRYSDAYVQQKGLIPVGDVAVTHGGGALKCKVVIHAVGPTSAYAPSECKRLIARVINESLTKAEKHNFISIAIPAISSGLFGVNKELVASCVIDSIISHKFSKAAPVLSDIRIVIIDEATYSCFAWHFHQRKAQLLGQVAPKQPPESQSAGVGKLVNIGPEVPSQPPVPANQNSKLNILDSPPPHEGQSGAPEQDSHPISSPVDPAGLPTPATPATEESNQGSSTDEEICLLTSEDLPTLVSRLQNMSYKWEVLAKLLGLDTSICERINKDHFRAAEKLEKVLSLWLQKENPTLKALIQALCSSTLKENTLAETIMQPALFQHGRKMYPTLPPTSNEGDPVSNAGLYCSSPVTTTPSPVSNPTSHPLSPTSTAAAHENMGATTVPYSTSFTQSKPSTTVAKQLLSTTSTSPADGNVPGNSPTMTPVSKGTTATTSYSPAAASYSTAAARAAASGGHITHTSGTGNPKAVTAQPRKDHKQGHVGAGGTGSNKALGTNGRKPKTDGAAANAAENKECPICLDEFKNPTKTKCGHQFCSACINKALEYDPFCPSCKKPLRPIVGKQPKNGKMTVQILHESLPGYHGCKTIMITYSIPGGIQGQEHPNPGKPYSGTTRNAYLPDNYKGREVLMLLQKAFTARMTFTIGTSVTTGAKDTVVWNDIHHKTRPSGGTYGYPDPTYLKRVKEELAARGIVADHSTV